MGFKNNIPGYTHPLPGDIETIEKFFLSPGRGAYSQGKKPTVSRPENPQRP